MPSAPATPNADPPPLGGAGPGRIRVASLQYYIRPVKTFGEFRDQVASLVESARDYKVKLLVFPEYFTVQLLTLGDIKRPVPEQVRALADMVGPYRDLMQTLAVDGKMTIVAGTIPTRGREAIAAGAKVGANVGAPADPERLFNESFVFGPTGEIGVQSKLHMTRWEREEWKVSPGEGLHIFEADWGKFAVAICYDVEFPELARAAAREGCNVLVVPSCTDDRQGYLRVRYCAQARAIENQMYVIHSPTVGSLPAVPAVSLNYGQAAIYTPSDFSFARDGILAEGNINQEMMVIAELDLTTIARSRENGTVLPLHDSQTTAAVLNRMVHQRL